MSVSSGGGHISRTEAVADHVKGALGVAVGGAEGEVERLGSRSSGQSEAVWSETVLGKVAVSHLLKGFEALAWLAEAQVPEVENCRERMVLFERDAEEADRQAAEGLNAIASRLPGGGAGSGGGRRIQTGG